MTDSPTPRDLAAHLATLRLACAEAAALLELTLIELVRAGSPRWIGDRITTVLDVLHVPPMGGEGVRPMYVRCAHCGIEVPVNDPAAPPRYCAFHNTASKRRNTARVDL